MKIIINNLANNLPDYLAMYFSTGIDALNVNQRIWDWIIGGEEKYYLVTRKINRKSKIFTIEDYLLKQY